MTTSLPISAGPRVPYLSIRPTSGWSALNLRETWLFRDLLLSLAARDLKLRYKQTALGIAWVVLQPLMAAGVFTFVFGLIAKMPSGKTPYFLLAYAGLLGWNAFNSTLTKTSACLVQNAQLVSKVYFPRLVLPLSTIFSTLVDFSVALAMYFLMMPFYGVFPTFNMLLLPVWFVLLTLLAVGAGLYVSALTVSYRDVQYIMPVITQLLLYGSPVAYGVSAVPENLRMILMVNPLTGILEAFRWSLLGEGSVHWYAVGYGAVFAVLIFFAGAMAFRKMERRFADVI